jgi:pimeloyl-ACP methyl ester carboxylesterase
MRRMGSGRMALGAAAILAAALTVAAHAKAPSRETITFASAGDVTVYGDVHRPAGAEAAPLIILFHQARSNARGEYGAVIPRLVAAGYNVLAIDQRSGGSHFGAANRTVAKLAAKDLVYCDAYPDLVGALRYATAAGFTGKRIVWGSSYSAGLVIRLGVDHPGLVDAVLAFSPASGPPMKDCGPNEHIALLKQPTLALRPGSEMEYDATRAQFAAFAAAGHETFVAENGVHGSSMLDPGRAGEGVEETWRVVLEFLARVAESP